MYIGSGLFSDRRYNHFKLLRQGVHHNWKLAQDYAGEETYEFIEIDEFDTEQTDRDMLFVLEQMYIDFYRPYYNISDVQRATAHRAKDWIVEGPDGVEHHIHNLKDYCRKHDLTHANLLKVARGQISNHKGHRCRFPTDRAYRFVKKINQGSQKTARLAAKRYLVTHPTGETKEIVGLNPFCNAKDICIRTARKAMRERRSHRGYTFVRLYD